MALFGSMLLAISAFLPWGSTEYVSVNGLHGDGVYTVSLGVLAFLLLFIRRVPIFISFIFGAAGMAIGVIDMLAMAKATEPLSGSVGNGLYITVVSGFIVVLGVIIETILERKKKINLFYLDDDPLAEKK